MAATLPPDIAISITLGEAGTITNVVVDTVEAILQNVSTPILLSLDPVKGDTGSQGPPGQTGPPGPPSSSAVSANANNKATLGTDSLILVQGTAPGIAASVHAQTVSGDDPQLTNSRIPTAHAASHLGTDPIPVASTTQTGLAPVRSGSATTYLNGAGTYTTPVGNGDMLKSVYDTNADNIVDQAAAVPWTGVTGKPTTFPPDNTAMLKSVYDTNSDNIVDHAALSDAAPWTGITGKPATFPPDVTAELIAHKGAASGYASLDAGIKVPVAQLPIVTPTAGGAVPTPPNNTTTFLRGDATFAIPSGIVPSAHASTHVTGGSDVIAAFTSGASGLVPASGGVAGTFLRSDGTFAAPTGGGDMLKSIYDVNNDGIVDRAGITFFTLAAAYTLTNADSGKYVICSGGSWTLTLPAPSAGLSYRLRNDMGISGTTGTITLQPNGGTIDGLASMTLLPQQECTLICNGTNWRTHELKREVVLGTVDITVATAALTILLPIGYRVFELDITACNPAIDNVMFQGQLSLDGGSTFLTQYWYAQFATAGVSGVGGAAPSSAQTVGVIGGGFAAVAQGVSNQAKMTLYPGSSISLHPSWISDSMGYSSGGPVYYQTRNGVFGPLVTSPVNAIKMFFASGNIANLSLTVKGRV